MPGVFDAAALAAICSECGQVNPEITQGMPRGPREPRGESANCGKSGRPGRGDLPGLRRGDAAAPQRPQSSGQQYQVDATGSRWRHRCPTARSKHRCNAAPSSASSPKAWPLLSGIRLAELPATAPAESALESLHVPVRRAVPRRRPSRFACDLSAPSQPLRHPWRHCVGSCHAPLALRADWQQQLTRAHRELGFRHVRFHGLLSDDMGTLVNQDNQFLFSFFNIDRVFDFLLSIGMKPLVELSFMPATLSSDGNSVFHYRANVTPPRRMADWQLLMTKLVGHWVERYGIDEVAQWPLEVWNEPNLVAFWTGGQAKYFELFKATWTAVKAISPRLQVGGPATAANAWLDEFNAFCAANALPARLHQHPLLPDRRVRLGRHRHRLAARRRAARRHARPRARGARGRGREAAVLHRVEHHVEPARPDARRPVLRRARHAFPAERRRPGRRLQLVGVHRHLRGELLPQHPVPRRLRAAQPVRRAQAGVPRLPDARPARHAALGRRRRAPDRAACTSGAPDDDGSHRRCCCSTWRCRATRSPPRSSTCSCTGQAAAGRAPRCSRASTTRTPTRRPNGCAWAVPSTRIRTRSTRWSWRPPSRPSASRSQADGDGRASFTLPLPANAMALVRIEWEAA